MIACAVGSGCANSPPPDNPSGPGAFNPRVDERREARALEQAEMNCVAQGKRAEAQRVEGDTIYTCVDR